MRRSWRSTRGANVVYKREVEERKLIVREKSETWQRENSEREEKK